MQMSKNEIKGCVTMITGARRGMGATIAKAFSKEGAKITLTARTKNDLETIGDSILVEGR